MRTVGKKIRIGLLIDTFDVSCWIESMLSQIINSDYSEIVLVVKNNSKIEKKSLWQKFKENRKNVFYHLYRFIDNNFFKPKFNAFEIKNIANLLSGIPILNISPIQKKYSDWIRDKDIKKIGTYNTDVLLRFGFRILRGKILNLPKFGIWSYHHGDNRFYRGGPAGVWEFLNNEKETGSLLQVMSEDLDGGKILYQSSSRTHPFSVILSLNNFYWKTADFIPRVLKQLYSEGEENFKSQIVTNNQHPLFYSKRLFKYPKNNEFLLKIIKKYFALFCYAFWKIFNDEQWVLLYSMEKNISFSMFRYKLLSPPKNKFWADPFVVYKDNHYFIFLEEYCRKQKKGHISMIQMDKEGNHQKPQIILEKEYHLSYPFVFEDNGNYYLIPESRTHQTIELYRCVEFPNKWEFVMNLMENIQAVDTTLYKKEGIYYLFTTIKRYPGSNTHDELFLFYSDRLMSSQWIEHPKNPIVSDVKQARPAGALFVYNKNLYRPSQNCSYRYGVSTSINVVKTLTKLDYEEKKVSSIKAHWDKKILKTHSFAYSNGLSVIDGLRKRSKLF